MLPDSRIAGFSGNFSFTRPRWLFSFGMGFVSNMRRNMLFYSVLQSLGGASYVARITLARKLIYNRTFLCGRNAVLLNGRKGLFRTINNTWVDRKETISNGPILFGFQNVGSCYLPRVVLDRPGTFEDQILCQPRNFLSSP